MLVDGFTPWKNRFPQAKSGFLILKRYKKIVIHSFLHVKTCFLTTENLFFSGNKTLNQSSSFLLKFGSNFLLFLPVLALFVRKQWKNMFRPAIVVRRTQKLVKIYNNFSFIHEAICNFGNLVLVISAFPFWCSDPAVFIIIFTSRPLWYFFEVVNNTCFCFCPYINGFCNKIIVIVCKIWKLSYFPSLSLSLSLSFSPFDFLFSLFLLL